MGLTKRELFTTEDNQLALSARVLAHPARIAILNQLLKLNHCINGELVEELGLAQPTISQHLKELKAFGLIKGTIEGTSISYCINAEKWEEVKSNFEGFFNQFDPDSLSC